jgi:hypothetical protein
VILAITNLRGAFAELIGPLRFGDNRQIEAVNFIARVQLALDKIALCPHRDDMKDCEECDGEGEVDCGCLDCGHVHEKKCPTCGGTGDGKLCQVCLQGLPSAVELEVRSVIKHGWPSLPKRAA